MMTYNDSRREKANKDFLELQNEQAQITYKNDIKDWLQANPTIGTLNNGKFYILPNNFYLTGNVQYIAPLSKI